MDDVCTVIALYYFYKKRQRRRRRYWVQPFLQDRFKFGTFNTLLEKLREDEEKFSNFFRMSRESFDKLLRILRNHLTHEDTNMKNCISPAERLAVTVRYLASGNTFTDLHYSFRIGIKAISRIVREVCSNIWLLLHKEYMAIPDVSTWQNIAYAFEKTANFPNCIGAVDSKHIRLIKPEYSGSMYFNYKGYCSIVLMVIADSNYNFIYVDVGAYGKDCDSSVFKESSFWKKLQENALDIPTPRQLSNTDVQAPYVLVGDEAFALHMNLLRPYGGRELDQNKRIFNYPLSRARRFIECSFGIMTNKWRIFHRPLNVSIDLATDIVKACCILKKFIRKEEGLNRNIADTAMDIDSELNELTRSKSVRGSLSANDTRTKFASYFVSEAGQIPWKNKFA
ncbi:unnamed protein product [Acanthoscelides obtectus]|uniref:DDE Tnp4 domain-containing protein n=1 Tax=Acanthoscelides obtectus TaxID=200917 RepID=A0A9P0PNS3_ACAOB|nr:unnamed protein product [Acanthoscelides obtectus]CAK1680595.1 Protein ALP1-like [Acanthoscelides obtectus]